MRAEGGRRADDRAQVAWIGDRVQSHDQRRAVGLDRRGRAGRRDARSSYAGSCRATPWCTAAAVSRSSSFGSPPAVGRLRAGGELEDVPQPVVALGALGDVRGLGRDLRLEGLQHRSCGRSPTRRRRRACRCGGRPRRAAARCRRPASAAFFARYAAWYGRSSAFGVGPLPSRPRRTRPPEPAVLPLPRLRTAPLRWLLPTMSSSTCSFVLQWVVPGPGTSAVRPGCR